MKRLSFYWLVIFTLSFSAVQAQCDATRLINDYVGKLTDYNFLKGYKFIDPKPANEYSYVFAKGTTYKITLCLENEKKKSDVKIMIFDRARVLVASNELNKGKKKNVLEFACTASGIYYMQYEFIESNGFCGASVLAFKRN